MTISDTCTGGTAPNTYAWTPGGATTSSITVSPTVTTTYSVTATDATGATQSGSVDDHGQPGAVVLGVADDEDD